MNKEDSNNQLNYLSMESKKLFSKLQYEKDETNEQGCFE
jgi:hypothetical protein